MTDLPDRSAAASAEASGFFESLKVYLELRVLVVLLLGFSSGLPLALAGSTLQAWMTDAGVSLAAIGLFALVGTPYTFKFCWAPFMDAYDAPVLSRLLGRRRGWLVLSQLILIAAILWLGFTDPQTSPWLVALAALVVATASATQDIVIDAYRVESLPPDRQAAASASYVAAYRVGMLVSGAGTLLIVDRLRLAGMADIAAAWRFGFAAMALLILVGVLAAFMGREPRHAAEKAGDAASRLLTVAIAAFRDFLTMRYALLVLLFVLLYKFCDAFAGTLTVPFLLKLGFTKTQYAAIAKGVGFAAALAGGFAGGALARNVSMASCLWIGGILQMLSNLAFSWQALVGVDEWALTLTIVVENFTGGVGTVMFVAYLSALCRNPLHTATQYALLSAFAAFGRTYLSSGAGFIAEETGWVWFFIITAFAALPGLALLAWLQARGHFAEFELRRGGAP
jgi:PAT family beta-lactamase induction signal transducer AmpG